jgi:hypothetical protein
MIIIVHVTFDDTLELLPVHRGDEDATVADQPALLSGASTSNREQLLTMPNDRCGTPATIAGITNTPSCTSTPSNVSGLSSIK